MTIEHPWLHTQNVFLNVTKRSSVLAAVIINHHDAQLLEQSGDPDINNLYAVFHPLCVMYGEKYANRSTAIASRISANSLLRSHFRDLSSVKIEDWEIALQNIHKRKTYEYEAILPHFREPFQKGRATMRIYELKSLSQRLENKP